MRKATRLLAWNIIDLLLILSLINIVHFHARDCDIVWIVISRLMYDEKLSSLDSENKHFWGILFAALLSLRLLSRLWSRVDWFSSLHKGIKQRNMWIGGHVKSRINWQSSYSINSIYSGREMKRKSAERIENDYSQAWCFPCCKLNKLLNALEGNDCIFLHFYWSQNPREQRNK